MTSAFFEEWLKEVDQNFHSNGQHVVLTINNFPGHIITYKPTNIKLIYFEPNFTPYIQPLDAGIIQCFKPLGDYADGKTGMGHSDSSNN